MNQTLLSANTQLKRSLLNSHSFSAATSSQATMSDKSYVDQAKEALGSAQQKASEALGSAKDTLTGTVSA